MKDWTLDERLKHEKGRALMQSARDTRRNRIRAEEKARTDQAIRQAAAQRAADEAAKQDRERRIRTFMNEMTISLAKNNLSMNPIQPVMQAGSDVPLFYVSDRTEYMGRRYLVNVRPGVGFNWNVQK